MSERYTIEENDDEDWPHVVCDSQRFDDDGNTMIICMCNDKQYADDIMRAMNAS